MSRYSIVLHKDTPEYVAACYSRVGNGLRTTLSPEDACSWVVYERASEVALHLTETLGIDASIRRVNN